LKEQKGSKKKGKRYTKESNKEARERKIYEEQNRSKKDVGLFTFSKAITGINIITCSLFSGPSELRRMGRHRLSSFMRLEFWK
jgi:hypothetical protein